MLQQTTVAAVKPFFERFVNKWPDVAALAAAEVADVMGAWAGLGYYSRARNLHACAKVVARDFAGRFPATAARLRDLPGVGNYTSAAIAAIAFDEAVPVVDGNVERVTTRLLAIDTPLPKAKVEIRAALAAMLPTDRPGDFAQAMMDLGATVCTPRKPACVLCPWRPDCRAAAEGRQDSFPVKPKKSAKPQRRGAAFVAVRASDGAIWLRRRPPSGLLGGMSEPPSTGWSSRADGETGASAAPFPAAWAAAGTAAHGFTHFDLVLEVWRADVPDVPPGTDGRWVLPAELGSAALPTLMRKVVDAALTRRPAPSARGSGGAAPRSG